MTSCVHTHDLNAVRANVINEINCLIPQCVHTHIHAYVDTSKQTKIKFVITIATEDTVASLRDLTSVT